MVADSKCDLFRHIGLDRLSLVKLARRLRGGGGGLGGVFFVDRLARQVVVGLVTGDQVQVCAAGDAHLQGAGENARAIHGNCAGIDVQS